MRLLSVDARAISVDRRALARLIESAEADVACVHGGPHLLRWRSIAAALGRRSGLVVVTGGRPAGANLVLSTLAVDVVATHDLAFGGGSVRVPAGAALAVLRLRGTRFVVAAATLVGAAAQRVRQAQLLAGDLAELGAGETPTLLSVRGAVAGGAASEVLTRDRVAVADQIFGAGALGVTRSRELDGYAAAPVPPVVIETGE